jgi:outer membrane protein TolC
MLRFLVFVLTVFVIIQVENLNAQEKLKLSVDDCIKIAMDKNKTIKVSISKKDQAEAKASEVNAGLLPTLKFSGGYTRLSELQPLPIAFRGMFPQVYNNYRAVLTASQPIFTGNRLSSNADMMELQAKATTEDLNRDRIQLVYDIKNAYWSYFKALDFKKAIGENINQIKAHLKDVENFSMTGLATNNDVLKVKVQLSNMFLMAIDADNAVQLSLLALNNTLGIPLNTEIELTQKIDNKNTQISELNTVQSDALNIRPELKAMDIRIRAGEQGVKMAQAGWYPQIFLGANFYYNRPNQRIFPTEDAFKSTWDVSLNINMDIWNWKTTAYQTEQAKAQLEQAEYGLSQLKDAVTFDVLSSYLSYNKSKEKINVSEEAVAQAEENYRVTNEKFKSGVAINSDLLDAETALLQAKINYTTALVDYEISLAKLDRSVGK